MFSEPHKNHYGEPIYAGYSVAYLVCTICISEETDKLLFGGQQLVSFLHILKLLNESNILGNFLGGYFLVGWSHDFFRMPELVRDANNDPKFIEKFKENIRKHQRPPFSTNKFLGQIMISYLWCQVFMMAVPEDEFHGFNFNFLHWLIPFVVALGK